MSARAPLIRAALLQNLLSALGFLVLAVLVTLVFVWTVHVRNDVDQLTKNVNVTVGNFPPPVTTVSVDNYPPPVTTVSVDNFPAQFNVNITDTVTLPVSLVEGSVNLTGNVIFPSSFEATISNFPSETNVTVLNPVTTVSVDNFPQGVIAQAVTPSGNVVNVSATTTGSLQVNLREPTSAFGSIMTESLWPIFQTEAVYGVNPGRTSVHTFGTGTVTASDSAFVISTGITATSFATLQSRKRLFYRPGQGSRVMWSAAFPTQASPLIIRLAGLGSPEDGVFFGVVGGAYGLLYANRGKREIRTLTITTGSSTTESVTVTLNDVAYNVPVTNSGNIQQTVWELGQFIYAGWRAGSVGATVVFISDQATPYAGAFSFNGTTAVGSFALTRVGVVPTQTFVAQSSWNGDRLDGTGTSGVTIDPTKFNLYSISMGYLGASAIRFMVQVIPPGTSDVYFAIVHTLLIPNSLSTTTFGNPSFPFSVVSRTLTNMDGTVQVGSFSGFIEGQPKYLGNRYTIQKTLSTTIDATTCYPFFTIRNAYVRNGVANQGVVTIVGVSGSVKHTQPATIYLYRSPDTQTHGLDGNPNFAFYGSNTGILYDDAATSFTPANNAQLIWSRELAETGSGERYFLSSQDFESISLEPGEYITVCGKTNMGIAAYVSASLEVREDE